MAPSLQDDRAGSLILSVQGVQTDKAARQVQGRDQLLLRHWNLVGLLIHQGASKVVLTRHGDGGENGGAAAMTGFLAIHHNQFLRGGSAKQKLNLEQLFVKLGRVDARQETAESRLGRSRVFAF